MNDQSAENINSKPLTLEVRIIIALVKRLGVSEIEIDAAELSEAVGLAMYPNEDASKVVVKTI